MTVDNEHRLVLGYYSSGNDSRLLLRLRRCWLGRFFPVLHCLRQFRGLALAEHLSRVVGNKYFPGFALELATVWNFLFFKAACAFFQNLTEFIWFHEVPASFFLTNGTSCGDR